MAKTIRFSELVKRCGRPDSVTLWAKPEEHPIMRKAIRDNRVLTVIQEPTRHKTDFGLIGFQEHQFALYFVFPKRLPKAAADTTVIGIHYDLIKETGNLEHVPNLNGKRNDRPNLKPLQRGKLKAKPPPPTAAPKPALKRYTVKIVRTGRVEITLEVAAPDLARAQETALQISKQTKFAPPEILDSVKSISEIEPG